MPLIWLLMPESPQFLAKGKRAEAEHVGRPSTATVLAGGGRGPATAFLWISFFFTLLVVYMLIFAKSAQFKTLGRLGGAPALFNINEPIVFGTPIVMNPLLIVPFFLTPMLTSTLLYFAMSTGMLPLFTGVMAPWTTPPIISGLIIGGWKHALFQAFILLLSVATYYMFARKVDLMAYADEEAAREAEANVGV